MSPEATTSKRHAKPAAKPNRKKRPSKKHWPAMMFVYGCKPPHVNLEAAQEQIFLSHQFSNEYKAIELSRREQSNAVVAGFCPELGAIEVKLLELEIAIDSREEEIRRRNARQRKKAPTDDDKKTLGELRKQRKELRAQAKELRAVTYKNAGVKRDLAKIQKEVKIRIAKARQAPGLYWGNYTAIERSLQNIGKGLPRKPRRYTGEGRVAVRLEENPTWEQLCSGKSTKLRIDPIPGEAWDNGQPHAACRTDVRLRIGTGDKDQPVYTNVEVVFHRPLPRDSVVVWAWLIRKRVATNFNWSLQLSVRVPERPHLEKCAKTGRVGVDLGWRLLPEGLRVACWHDHEGKIGELVLSREMISSWKYTRHLQGRRDTNFDIAREQLVHWRGPVQTLPEWFQTEAETLAQWKSPNRLAKLVIHWRAQRFEGDAEIFDRMEAWRKQDRHLYEWQANQARKFQARRLVLYRDFAAKLRAQYQEVVVPDLKLAQMRRDPPADLDDQDQEAYKTNRDAASSGILRSCLTAAFAVARKAPTSVLSECGACGKPSGNQGLMELMLVCGNCGVTYDRDRNAAERLQHWGAVTAPETA